MVIEDSDIIEDKILCYIDDKIKMIKFRNTMDNKLHKKIFTDVITDNNKTSNDE